MSSLQQKLKQQRLLDTLFVGTTRLFAFLVLASLGGILISLVIGALPSMREFGFGFFTSSNWDTVQGQYGALAPIYGTLVTSAIALLIAVPVSFGIAVVSHRIVPGIFAPAAGHCGGTFSGHSLDYLRHVGLVCVCTRVCRLYPAVFH